LWVKLSRNGLAIRRRLCAAGIDSLAKRAVISSWSARQGLGSASIAAMSIYFVVR
jgi:hypothetical protein